MLKNIKNYLISAFVLISLISCGSGNRGANIRSSNDAVRNQGLDYYQQQNYFAATEKLLQVWEKSPNDTEVYIALLDSWSQMGEVVQVWKLLNESTIDVAEIKIIEAELSGSGRSCEQAIELSQNIDAAVLNNQWATRFWLMRANCLDFMNRHLAAAVALINISSLETDELIQTDLQDQIVKRLIQVDEEDLILAIGDPAYDSLTQGWIEAAYVNFGADGKSGSNWLQQWFDHPAASYFLDLNKVNAHQKVAILLPFSGRFSAVAKAVQKGLLTAATADPGNQNELIFYDTGSQGENLSNAWYSAQENQADLIIGPLDKSSIDAVMQMPAPTVPVVLLNQAESDYFQFTLSPEGEAMEVAERMIKDGQKRVLVLAPNEPWGERMTQAFAQKFVDLGGQIINNSYLQPKQNDYSAQLRQILGLIESQLRAKNLQQFLKLNLSSEEVVRSDIDAIFLAARPEFARLMVPQLKFHHAADIPVYATSHVFDGLTNEQHNRDLQGLRFALSPIELQSNNLQETISFDLARIGGDKKLFAFGYDAYQLISRLEWMNRVNTGVVNGLSGKVSLGFDGIFNRSLLWAQYNNGSVVALPH